jgi:protein TonB
LPELELQEPEVLEVVSKPLPEVKYSPRLFADVLLEVDGSERRRRKWAAFSSVMFQSLLLGFALLFPLMFTEALPKQQLLTMLIAPPPPPPPPPPAAPVPVRTVARIDSDLMDGQLRTPSRIPEKVQMIREEEAPPPVLSGGGGVIGGVPGGIPGGQLGGVIGGIISDTNKTVIVPKLAVPTAPKRIRVSQGVTRGLLVNKVEPGYPKIAVAARIEGQVVLSAIISKTGEIINLEVVSGHPILIPAAIEAVKQWRYRPFLLNGEPLEVETTINVNFQLARGV